MILWKYADGVPQVSGQGTFGTYWMKRLGVTDKALEATGFAQASMEQIYSWDPDILFLDGPGLQPLRTEDVLSGNVDGADFSTLTAVKSGRVYNTTLGILVVRTSSSWVSRATIRVFCWMARWKNFFMMKMAIKSASAVFVPEKYLVQNWPVLAGRQVRSVCVPVRAVP